ncbi:MAG: tRNA (N6-threonylcarbamoyladenosine(37)-N6)-methyltransferase TrmO [Candidatus Lokiarchaeota archaeon]|nr:tRNA (N6-threonylcarbamoyladenosine(37)-N6)-methyltransferase TrmO [Candidatus Lokiarchaeota archaeon]
MEISKRELISFKERKFPEDICFRPIGIIHSPFTDLTGIAIQPTMSNAKGKIEVFKHYQDALKDLDGFSHIFCLYFFDMVKLPVPLQSKPFLKDEIMGVFAIRTPFRPNPIGLSILELIEIKDNILYVNNLDILDKTPVIDIKPYIPQFDNRETQKIGWLEGNIRRKVS